MLSALSPTDIAPIEGDPSWQVELFPRLAAAKPILTPDLARPVHVGSENQGPDYRRSKAYERLASRADINNLRKETDCQRSKVYECSTSSTMEK